MTANDYRVMAHASFLLPLFSIVGSHIPDYVDVDH
jgi:hypothetical protein